MAVGSHASDITSTISENVFNASTAMESVEANDRKNIIQNDECTCKEVAEQSTSSSPTSSVEDYSSMGLVDKYDLARELFEQAKEKIDQTSSFGEADDVLMSYKERLMALNPSKWAKLVEHFETYIKKFAVPLFNTSTEVEEKSLLDEWADCF